MAELNHNGETRQTKNIRRGDKNCNAESNTGSLGASTVPGGEYGFIKVSVGRESSERSNSVRYFGDIIGGILRQLITQAHSQLAARLDDIRRSENQVQELKIQINELSELLEALEKSKESQDQE